MKPLIVSNLILRIENPVGDGHPELEVLALPDDTLWLKDYDVFTLTETGALMETIADAARIAAEVQTGIKYLHVELDNAHTALRLPPPLLQALGASGCTLEVYGLPDENDDADNGADGD